MLQLVWCFTDATISIQTYTHCHTQLSHKQTNTNTHTHIVTHKTFNTNTHTHSCAHTPHSTHLFPVATRLREGSDRQGCPGSLAQRTEPNQRSRHHHQSESGHSSTSGIHTIYTKTKGTHYIYIILHRYIKWSQTFPPTTLLFPSSHYLHTPLSPPHTVPSIPNILPPFPSNPLPFTSQPPLPLLPSLPSPSPPLPSPPTLLPRIWPPIGQVKHLVWVEMSLEGQQQLQTLVASTAAVNKHKQRLQQ